MTKLHSFKDSKGQCFANVRMDNDDPIFIGVAQTGVLVKKSKIGLFGPKLYDSRTVYDAAVTAKALDALFPDYWGPDGMTNAVLRAFTNAALYCSTTWEVTNLFNTAVSREKESSEEDLQFMALAMIRRYGGVLATVFKEEKAQYPAGVYPQSLLPMSKPLFAKVLAHEIERASDPHRKRELEVGLALLDSFIDDNEANQQNAELKALLAKE